MTDFKSDGLYFVPLGGADIIGMNMYAYASEGKFIVVDAGYGFLKDAYPPMDMCYASPEFLKEHADDIEGLFITHAHEDHLGAVAQICSVLKCKVYATPLAVSLIKLRLKEFSCENETELYTVFLGETIETSAFKVRFISLTHSVPETCGLFIQTKFGNVFHATDWRFDDGQMAEYTQTDFNALKEASQTGVDLFVCDSTNIMVENKQPNESKVRKNLIKLISGLEGSIVATCFSSNLMRLESLILAADKAGRTPVIMGRSMMQYVKAAKECGYFSELPKIYQPEEVTELASDNALYICTGSQADYRSTLSSIASGENKYVRLDESYTVIFSSKVIPGNEEKIERMQEKILEQGAKVITLETELIHASGHASKEEIRQMYELLKPKIVFPVHGDKSFIREHKRFAADCGVEQVQSGKNGEVFCLKNGEINKIDTVCTEVIGVEFLRSVPLNSELVKNRKKIAYNGVLFISAYVSEENKLLALKISSPDILEAPLWDELAERIKEKVWDEINEETEKKGVCFHTEELIKARIRKLVLKETEMKPLTILHIFKQGETK